MPRVKKQSYDKKKRLKRDRARITRASTSANNIDEDSDEEIEEIDIIFSAFRYTLTGEQIGYGKTFDRELKSITWNFCTNCKAGFPNMMVTNNICQPCKKNNNKFTKLNNMDPGEIPEHLPELNEIEQMLIAMNHPLVKVYRKRGGQNHYSGHVISFPQNISTYVNKLPHTLDKIPYYIIFDAESKSGVVELQADASKLRSWLVWLKENNVYYHHVDIDESVLATINETDDISKHLNHFETDVQNDELQDDELHSTFVPSEINVDQDQIIADKLHLKFPAISTTPINEFSEVGYLVRSFPTLFPYGVADVNDPRIIKVTILEYFQYLMRFRDGRFATNERFLYIAQNTVQRHRAISHASIYIRQKLVEKQTVSDLKAAITENQKLADSIAAFSASLREIRTYWKQRSAELLCMVEQYGQPHLFFTLSAADCRWPDIYNIVTRGNDGDNVSTAEKIKIMNKNPMLTGWYFYYRSITFFEVLKKHFKVIDYWYRYEWQNRGSPHLHGVLWIKDGPIIGNEVPSVEKLEEIRLFFDDLSFAWNVVIPIQEIHPSEVRFSQVKNEDRESDLINLLNWVQRHTRCGSYCLRFNKFTKKFQCRYKFPKKLQDVSSVEEADGYWEYCPARNDEFITRYNPFVTMLWRANTDFSAIVGMNGILSYIAKYVAKPEVPSNSLVEVMRSCCDKFSENDSAKKVIKNYFTRLISERDYSAQEVCHILMGWNMYSCSRNFVTVNLSENSWQKLEVNNDGTEFRTIGILQRYCNRPEKYHDLSLYKFAKTIHGTGTKYNVARHENVVRIIPQLCCSNDNDPNDKYYKMQCMLHIPFKGDINTLLRGSNNDTEHDSWKSLYESSNITDNIFLQLTTPEDEGEIPESIEDYTFQSIAQSAYEFLGNHESEELGYRPIDNVDWLALSANYPSPDDALKFWKNLENNATIPNNDNNNLQISMSIEQNVVLELLESQINYIKQCNNGYDNLENIYKECVVQGRAGCGKSTLIKEMVKRIRLEFGTDAVAVTAPTGIAAVNIDGITCHSQFKLPISNSSFTALEGTTLRQFQVENKDLKFVIVDEMSMLSAQKIHQIESRLSQLRPHCKELYGGICIYFIGDYRQLPPVMECSVYESNPKTLDAIHGIQLFNNIGNVVQLNNVHRQQSTDGFSKVLEKIATKELSDKDYRLLSTRNCNVLSSEEVNDFKKNAIYVCATKAVVKARNEEHLRSTGQPIARIISINEPDVQCSGDEDFAEGLPTTLKISVGSRIMLTHNISVKLGLANGSTGIVTGIVYDENSIANGVPVYILVRIDGYRGPCLIDDAIPIFPKTVTWKNCGLTCKRTQFSMVVAYAITIHKSQGLTLAKVILDIGLREFTCGLTYVALSRVRQLKDIIFMPFYNIDRFTSFCNYKQFRERVTLLNLLSVKSVVA